MRASPGVGTPFTPLPPPMTFSEPPHRVHVQQTRLNSACSLDLWDFIASRPPSSVAWGSVLLRSNGYRVFSPEDPANASPPCSYYSKKSVISRARTCLHLPRRVGFRNGAWMSPPLPISPTSRLSLARIRLEMSFTLPMRALLSYFGPMSGFPQQVPPRASQAFHHRSFVRSPAEIPQGGAGDAVTRQAC